MAADLPRKLNKSAFHQVGSCPETAEMGHTSRFQMSCMLNKAWRLRLQLLFSQCLEAGPPRALSEWRNSVCVCVCVCVCLFMCVRVCVFFWHKRHKTWKTSWADDDRGISLWTAVYFYCAVTWCLWWDRWSSAAAKETISFLKLSMSLIKGRSQ